MWVMISRRIFLHALWQASGQGFGHQKMNRPGNSCCGNHGMSWRRVPTYKTKVNFLPECSFLTDGEMLDDGDEVMNKHGKFVQEEKTKK